jgi:hypothetical protein
MRALRRLKLGLRRLRGSELDHVIAPEIRGDRMSELLEELAGRPDVRTVLEIGSSSGEGSTAALVRGAERQDSPPALHCIELSSVRFAQLAARYRDRPWVVCHNVSSVPEECFPTVDEVTRFHAARGSRLSRIPLDEVLRWLEQDRAYLREHGLSSNGIRGIRARHGIERFDLVLIDGSEFTGRAELDEVYGARFVVLDDTRTMKNLENVERLKADGTYRLLEEAPRLRNGFAAFERIG